MSSAPPPLMSESNTEAVAGGTSSDDLFESALGDDDSGLDGVGTNGDLTESSDRPKTGSDTMEDFSLQVLQYTVYCDFILDTIICKRSNFDAYSTFILFYVTNFLQVIWFFVLLLKCPI
jgi:hypothetical protein